jgi:hypothetical protein
VSCLNPSACKSKGFGLLCRSCNARRVCAVGKDALAPEQRALVAETIKRNPGKTYELIADDWLTTPGTIAKIARAFGVARRSNDRHS